MKYNFCAGPSALPKEVFQQASEAVLDYNGTGISILETSHRSPEFDEIIVETEQLIRELLEIPEGYSVILMQGGASTQFALVPLNLLPENGRAAYIDTGVWASNAFKEASLIGQAIQVASSAGQNYSYIPKDITVPRDLAYLHFTSNNTIYGTEFFEIPRSNGVPLVVDMSSNILSKKINVADYGLIYAGAQKNIGPAGLAIVIVKNDLLGKTNRQIPKIFDYQKHAGAGSRLHTPAVFSIYVSMLNLRWLKEKGGLAVIEQENIVKSRVLYEEIERNSLFFSKVNPEDRSRMNVCFFGETANVEKEFLVFAEENGIVGLKGHRSVGGFRASIYNAMNISGIHKLVDVMQEFEEIYQTKV